MTSSLEDIKTIDLEEWLTLATAPSPTKLKKGQSPNMSNVWVDEKPGSLVSAKGLRVVGFIDNTTNPNAFCMNYFKSSSGVETFVVSDNQTVWTTLDFQTFTPIIVGLSISFQLRGKVIRDKLWLTNGSDSVRVFDGSTVTVLDGTGGTPNVPKGRYIDYHDERVWIYHTSSNRSAAYFSSLTDSSGTIIAPDNANAWDTADNFIQISEGDNDYGTGMIVYRGYLHFFKQYSIWRLVGYDEYTYSRVKSRASTGTRFNESLQTLDSLVYLVGVDGIYTFDGEESERISDLIDSSTASQSAFGFGQINQGNQNQFWEVSSTADWNSGTIPTDLSISNAANYIAADDSQADFQAGVVQTNLDLTTTPGTLQLARASTGSSYIITSGLTGVLPGSDNGFTTSQIGIPSYLIDQNDNNSCGYTISGVVGTAEVIFQVNFSGQFFINQIALKNLLVAGNGSVLIANSIIIQVDTNGSNNWVTVATDGPPTNRHPSDGPITETVSFTATTCYKVRAKVTFACNGQPSSLTTTEFVVYNAAYLSTGQFTSKALNLGFVPSSLGNFSVDVTLNGEGASYYTQSSSDGVSWDSAVACTNGGAIGSTVRQYIRWGVNFTSDGLNTPQITAAYLPATYLSAIHDTGGSIANWGPFEADYNLAGETISFYYRGATSPGGITAATWNLINPGGVLSIPITDRYVQFKLEFSGGDGTHLPVVNSVTINWTTGEPGQTLQNVASAVWRNRYWLAGAQGNSTENNIILIHGKKSFGSPWQMKLDWNVLSFTKFHDNLFGGSAGGGNIFKADEGYSQSGAAIDAYFETGDFVFNGLTAQVIEIDVEVERMGPWNLNVGVSVDGGNTWDDYPVDLTLSSYDSNYIKKLNVSYTTTRFRLRFRTNGVDTPFQVHRCIVYYKLAPTRGSIIGDYLPSPA